MEISDRLELLHHVAETIRSGGDIDINPLGGLEMRSAGIAERLMHKISNMAGVGSEYNFKISEKALPEVCNLVSKVALEIDPKSTQAQQDFNDVKLHLAHIYFGHSLIEPWNELLTVMPQSRSMTLTSFAQSHQALIQEFEDFKTPARADDITPLIHRQYADSFIKLVQEAIKEGEIGRYDVEHSLLLLAERLNTGYYRAAMDPDITTDDLNKELAILHQTIMEVSRELILDRTDGFYAIFGGLSHSEMLANKDALMHVEAARKLAAQEPQVLLSGILDDLTTLQPQTIKDTLARLEVLPQQTDNIRRIRIELLSALRMQALSAIKFDHKNLSNSWSKRIFVKLLEHRVQYLQDQADYHQKRVAAHYQDLQSKAAEIRSHLAAAEAINKGFKTAPNSTPASMNLIKLQENLKQLNKDLGDADLQLELFIWRLKDKQIDPATLDHPPDEYFSREITSTKEKMTDPKFLAHSEKELDQKTDDLRKAYRFLTQREADLKEVLPDPLANMFD